MHASIHSGLMEIGATPATLDELRQAARECRGVWRWHWERFWILRWENALRRPSWRVEEEARAWRRMRAEVRTYAGLRLRIAMRLVSDDADPGAGTRIQGSLTKISR